MDEYDVRMKGMLYWIRVYARQINHLIQFCCLCQTPKVKQSKVAVCHEHFFELIADERIYLNVFPTHNREHQTSISGCGSSYL